MNFTLSQSTQFKIKELSLITKIGLFDISSIFEELNIFDSILMPCMSGNILITDSLALTQRLKFDGSEYIKINIVKNDKENTPVYSIEKTFRVYKQSNRTNNNQNFESYLLSFVSEEFVYSEQTKVNQSFVGKYSDVAKLIFKNYLKIPNKKIGNIDETEGIHKGIIPRLSPIESINWLLKRSVYSNKLADFVFFENSAGFNFVSLSSLYELNPLFTINFSPKNLTDSLSDEFLGVRNFNFISSFDLIDNIKNGFFANKFIGFDILTRTITEKNLDMDNVFGQKNLNKFPNASAGLNRENKDLSEMYDSKVTLYPFQTTRLTAPYVKKNDNVTATIIDDAHIYLPKRKAIFNNLLQKKICINLPGNFAISSGFVLNLQSHSYSLQTGEQSKDDSISGKYLVIGTRHIIKPDKHETICELASDSTNNRLIAANTQDLQKARNS
jgi:hypothetical protein